MSHTCDPMQAAGRMACPDCGAVGYPTDAAWIDSSRVLAAYADPPCQHRTTAWRTWIVDLTATARASQWCHRPTRNGDPCRNRVGDGQPCRHHRQQTPR